MPSAYFDGNMSADIVAQLTYHVFQVMGATTSALKVIIREGFLTIVLLAYLIHRPAPGAGVSHPDAGGGADH